MSYENPFNQYERLMAEVNKKSKTVRDVLAEGAYGPPQVPIATSPSQVAIQSQSQTPQTPPQKKAGWGWAFLIVGGGIFVFWGIPLIQGKGGFKPGITKPPGYVPTRNSPEE